MNQSHSTWEEEFDSDIGAESYQYVGMYWGEIVVGTHRPVI